MTQEGMKKIPVLTTVFTMQSTVRTLGRGSPDLCFWWKASACRAMNREHNQMPTGEAPNVTHVVWTCQHFYPSLTGFCLFVVSIKSRCLVGLPIWTPATFKRTSIHKQYHAVTFAHTHTIRYKYVHMHKYNHIDSDRQTGRHAFMAQADTSDTFSSLPDHIQNPFDTAAAGQRLPL